MAFSGWRDVPPEGAKITPVPGPVALFTTRTGSTWRAGGIPRKRRRTWRFPISDAVATVTDGRRGRMTTLLSLGDDVGPGGRGRMDLFECVDGNVIVNGLGCLRGRKGTDARVTQPRRRWCRWIDSWNNLAAIGTVHNWDERTDDYQLEVLVVVWTVLTTKYCRRFCSVCKCSHWENRHFK